MVGEEQVPIDRNVTLAEINVLIKHENNSRVLKRLYFVKFRYLGDSVEEAATKVGVTKKTGYYWQDYWNKGGYWRLYFTENCPACSTFPCSLRRIL